MRAGETFATIFGKFDVDGSGTIAQGEFLALHNYVLARVAFRT